MINGYFYYIQEKINHLEFFIMERQRIIVITGKKGSGKTTFAWECVSMLKKQGISAGGIVTNPDTTERYGEKMFYSAVDILTGEERKLLSTEKPFGSTLKAGRFFMDQEVLSWAAEVISTASKDCMALFIDELGPMELDGFGYAGIAKKLINRYKGLIIFIIRIEIVEQLCSYLHCDAKNTLFINVENKKDYNIQLFHEVLNK